MARPGSRSEASLENGWQKQRQGIHRACNVFPPAQLGGGGAGSPSGPESALTSSSALFSSLEKC